MGDTTMPVKEFNIEDYYNGVTDAIKGWVA
jgi:hypothetical protein